MAALRKAEVHNMIFASVKKRCALGNSNRRLVDVASDLLNASGEDSKDIAEQTYLSTSTIKRIMDCEDNYWPNSQTLERCFRYANAEVTFEEVMIKAQYANKPKENA